MATLLIDNRELKFIENSEDLIENNKNNIEIKQLALGDFVILSDTNNIIIERKTIDDLQKSIVDGRYRIKEGQPIYNYQYGRSEGIPEGRYNPFLVENFSSDYNNIFRGENTCYLGYALIIGIILLYFFRR